MKISNIIVRDRLHRIVASQLEKKRCALTMILNGKLEGATWSHRVRAMVELNRLPKHSDPNRIIDRCTETGRYRVYISDVKLARIRFRKYALSGELSGIKKAVY